MTAVALCAIAAAICLVVLRAHREIRWRRGRTAVSDEQRRL